MSAVIEILVEVIRLLTFQSRRRPKAMENVRGGEPAPRSADLAVAIADQAPLAGK